MDSSNYPCPCGYGNVERKTMQKQGPNHLRDFVICPNPERSQRTPRGARGCGFYSFVDELRLCNCGKGYCRNYFIGREKYWCCPLKGDADCGFSAKVVGQSVPASPSLLAMCASASPTSPCSSSTGTPTSTKEKRMEAIQKCLEISRTTNNALLDIIQDLAKLPLEE